MENNLDYTRGLRDKNLMFYNPPADAEARMQYCHAWFARPARAIPACKRVATMSAEIKSKKLADFAAADRAARECQ